MLVPKAAIVIGALALVAVSDATAQAQAGGVRWGLFVTDVLGERSYVVNRAGARLPSTGLDTCVQQPVHTFRDSNGDVQEEVRVTCDLVPAQKVTLIQTCYRAMPDRSFGAMRVDGVSPYTIALQCVTR
jgi:hypothetical protein